MTEGDGESTEYMVSCFIAGTCQLIPKSFSDASQHLHDSIIAPRYATNGNALLCGSSAEFYIQPLHSCIGDLDVLTSNTNQLVCSDDFPVLPSDLSGLAETIECYKIDSYEMYPGFVRLRILGKMDYNWECKKYEFNHSAFSGHHFRLDMTAIARSVRGRRIKHVGPAFKSENDSTMNLGTDAVMSVFVHEWPKDATNWPLRPRKHGWPTANTISEIVRNGCHVVYAQHRSCRDDKFQWRLSFSVAEVILLQSWTPTQQIVYHLLRFFAAKELIQKDSLKEDEVICNYHLKTLMLWTCEEMSPDWWNLSSVIAICCELLEKLSACVKARQCPNYFIPEANLFHEPSNLTLLYQIESRLIEFRHPETLSQWFFEYYILPITRTQYGTINREVARLSDFSNCMLSLIKCRKDNEIQSLDIFLLCRCSENSNVSRRTIIINRQCSLLHLFFRFEQYATCFNGQKHTPMACLQLTEKVLYFKYYEILLFLLHVAYALRHGEISLVDSLFVEFVDAISIKPIVVSSMYHNFPKAKPEENGRFQFLRAQDLMRNLTGPNSQSKFQLLSLMIKELLRTALEYDESKCNGIVPAALIYRAAIHFATSEYQQAIRLCSQVILDHTYQSNMESLNAGCLLFIDDVAQIVGMHLLHLKIIGKNLHYIDRRFYLDLRLSPEVFAYHITASSANRLGLNKHLDAPDSSFPMDDYLKALTKSKCFTSTLCNSASQKVYLRADLLTEADGTTEINLSDKETKITNSLIECSLETMVSFYSTVQEDFGIQCNTVDCYRALYLYQCRKYDEVLHLCERILQQPDLQNHLKRLVFANVNILPPFVTFFDRDVISLLGFYKFYNYLWLATLEIQKAKGVNSTFDHCNIYDAYRLTPERRTYYSDELPGYYLLGRHFLARYLKARCCIDSNLHSAEALAEFSAQKTELPFEHIIQRFFLQKLRQLRVIKNSY